MPVAVLFAVGGILWIILFVIMLFVGIGIAAAVTYTPPPSDW